MDRFDGPRMNGILKKSWDTGVNQGVALIYWGSCMSSERSRIASESYEGEMRPRFHRKYPQF